MAGLLDFLQTPQGQGLLSGVASYALNARRGTPVNNVGRGLAGGIAGYAQANEQQKAEQEKALRLKLVQDSMKAGISNQTLPGQKPIAQVGGNLYANPNDASAELEQNRFINQSSIPTNYAQMLGPNVQTQGLPRKGGVYGVPLPGAAPQGQPQGMPDYETEMANIMMARESGMPASMSPPLFPPQAEQEMPAIQVQAQREPLPEQATMIGGTPDQTETTFDPRKAAMAMAQSGDLESMRDGWKYLSEAQKSREFGTTPFISEDGNAYLIGKDGSIVPAGIKGQQKEASNPFGQDLREYLAVNGVNPSSATPQQLRSAYRAVDAIKKQRAAAGASNIVNYGAPQSVINPATGQAELVQFGNREGAGPKFTGLTPAPDTSKPPTEAEAKAAFYAENMKAASDVVDELEGKGFDFTATQSQFGTSMAGGVTNPLASKQAQQARQAQNQWAEQMLRMQTGAAATKDEITRTVHPSRSGS